VAGFSWTVADDVENSVFAFERSAPGQASLLAVCNFTPVPHAGYAVGASRAGPWQLLLDSSCADRPPSLRNIAAWEEPRHGRPCSLVLDLPGNSTLLFVSQEPQ
jgi:1,4-alpha-glucan branching enzyme